MTKTTEPEKIVATEATEKPEEIQEQQPEQKATAKAGKRSEKSVKEAEEKVKKEERKAKGDTTPQSEEAAKKVAQKQNPTRSRLERRGKNYRKVSELLENGKAYDLKEALDLAAKTNVGKFDGTIEFHINLNVDPRHADQNIRSTVVLPNGNGKTVRVAAFVDGTNVEKCKKAGADIVGDEEILDQLSKQKIDFDVLISTPQLMPKLGKFARVLGPRGLMPNPKSGTVAADPAKAITEAKAGKIDYRVDKQSIIHVGIGKKSFGADKLYENAKVFLNSVSSNKPASVKGALIKNISVSSSMGPGIKVNISSL